jgi:hypothetical protein
LRTISQLPSQNNALRRPLKISFENEAGQDAGGLTRDFFSSVATALGSAGPSELRVFKLTPAGSLVPLAPILLQSQPSEESTRMTVDSRTMSKAETAMVLTEQMAAQYRAIGRLSGMAILHGHKLGRPFAGYFLRCVCQDEPHSLEDLQREFTAEESVPATGLSTAVDFRGRSDFLSRNLSSDGLDGVLTMTRQLSGTATEVELVRGGSTLVVTNSTKVDWLRKSLHHKLVASVEQQAAAFREGLLEVVPGEVLKWFSAAELRDIFGGHAIDDTSLEQWQLHTRVDHDVTREAQWLWEWLKVQTVERRADLLAFMTGSSAVPIEGFAGIATPMSIALEQRPSMVKGLMMPTAATCFNKLRLPAYPTAENMGQALEVALEWGTGFGLA